jgi:hypothetical protein
MIEVLNQLHAPSPDSLHVTSRQVTSQEIGGEEIEQEENLRRALQHGTQC